MIYALAWWSLGVWGIIAYLNRERYSWQDPIPTMWMALLCGFVLGPIAWLMNWYEQWRRGCDDK
jgi:hypothetical protein